MKALDQKIVRFRQETDLYGIQKMMDRKANEEQVRNDFSNHEFKISTLDRNLIKMAADLETFQLAINKLHFGLQELQEANREVLIGKRTINCLSCGKGGDNYSTIKGRDGREYKGSDQSTQAARMNNSSN